METTIVWNKTDGVEATEFVIVACKNFDGKCAICEGYCFDGIWYTAESNEIDTSISVPYAWTTITAPPVEEFE